MIHSICVVLLLAVVLYEILAQTVRWLRGENQKEIEEYWRGKDDTLG